jgi:hypothetical protein
MVSVAAPDMLPDVALIVVVPAAAPVAKPLEPAALLTVATAVFDELHVTVPVSTCFVPSEYAPEAANCWAAPLAMLGLAGVTEIDKSVAGLTVSVVEPVTLPDIAVIVVVPAARHDARPFDPAALLIAATDVLDELQVADAVSTCFVPSEYVPVATNCLVVPLALVGLAGVTERDKSVAGLTVSVVEPDIVPDVTVIVVVPAATDVAKHPALTDATPVLDELGITCVVRSCVVLSENVPVAMNCWVVPMAMLGFAGVTATDTSVAEVTVSVVLPEVLPDVAVMVVVPAFFPYAYAFPLFLLDSTVVEESVEVFAFKLIVDTLVSDELQVTESVRSFVELSE